MKIGWIDFSEKDRQTVMEVLDLLSEQGATDELGIGTVRDAFANFFFPGTSTVQTRAKYFFIVSNLLQEVAAERGEVNDKLECLYKQEYKYCGDLKKKNSSGIIGSSRYTGDDKDKYKGYKDWVRRKPSDIYWSAIKTLGFFNTALFKTDNKNPKGGNRNSLSLSISDYLRLAESMYQEMDRMKKAGSRSVGTEGDSDDKSIPLDKFKKYWNWPFAPNWAQDLSIELTEEEAKFLSDRIESLQNQLPGDNYNPSDKVDTVYKILLMNWPEKENSKDKDSDSDSKFPKVVNIVYSHVVDNATKKLLDYALKFDELVYSARVAYNLIYRKKALEKAKGSDLEEKVKKALEEVQTEWDMLWENPSKLLQEINGIDLKDMFNLLELEISTKQDSPYLFLTKLIKAYNNYNSPDDFQQIENVLIEREQGLKNERAKLSNPTAKDIDWIGGKHLDYRAGTAWRIITDIKNAQKNN